MKQVDRPVLAPGKVLDEAYYEAVLGASLNEKGRNLSLAESLIRLEPTLSAHEVIPGTIGIVSTVTVGSSPPFHLLPPFSCDLHQLDPCGQGKK